MYGMVSGNLPYRQDGEARYSVRREVEETVVNLANNNRLVA